MTKTKINNFLSSLNGKSLVSIQPLQIDNMPSRATRTPIGQSVSKSVSQSASQSKKQEFSHTLVMRRMTSFHARTSVNASILSPCPWYSHLLPHVQKMPPNVVYSPILLLPRKHKTKTKAWLEIKSKQINWEGCLSEWNNLPKLKSWQRKHADCVWMPFSSYHGLDNRTVKV